MESEEKPSCKLSEANEKAKCMPKESVDEGGIVAQAIPCEICSKVIDAYFAVRKKTIRHDVNVSVIPTKVTKGNLASLSKQHYNVKIGDTVNLTSETEAEVTTITYERLTKAYIGDALYIVVKTADLQNGIVNVEIIGSNNTTFINPEQVGTFLQNNMPLKQFNFKVAITSEDSSATNAATLANFAIIPVKLGPLEPNPLQNDESRAWGAKIDATAEKAAFLHLSVKATAANGNKIEYSNNDEKLKSTTADKGLFLNTPDTWLRVLFCPCCLYKVSDGYIVSNKVTKNAIAALENSTLSRVNAIILHRTGGASASSAINSFSSTGIGTHFIVDTDGVIKQTASLNKSTSHVGKIRSKCSVERSCNSIEAKRLKKIAKVLDIHNHEVAKKYPERYPYNGDSVGIEVVGLSYDKDKKPPKSGDDVESWDALTALQITSVACLVNNLLSIYNLTRSDIYFHEQVSYKGKLEGETVYNAIGNNLK